MNTEMDNDLEPIDPAVAVNMYLNHREPELSKKSIQNQRYHLNSFVGWCQEHGIENLNDLVGRDTHRFRTARRNEDIASVTRRGQLATLRVFLEFCQNIEAVDPGMRERVVLPEGDPEEASKDEKLDEDWANVILEHLEQYNYTSREHVVTAILWQTGSDSGVFVHSTSGTSIPRHSALTSDTAQIPERHSRTE